ncbi:MAG: UDP-N-acetylmuramoyl-tripeptide--D-alanyl-D-alanine ligase [Actinomycetota bacterium]
MIPLSAGEIARIVRGELKADKDVLVTQAPTLDSREAISGSIFLALKGERVDGHDFVDEAVRRGAVLALVSQPVAAPSIVVKDVQVALGLLALHVRELLADLKVVAITGSQGKTTTKDLLAWTLGLVGSTVATKKNLNNELGLPITLLSCDYDTKYCVLEMGARHVGDIAALCAIAQPNIGVVLNVGTAHIGEFGDRAAIAQTKFELLQNLKPHGVAIVGRYDSFTLDMAEK